MFQNVQDIHIYIPVQAFRPKKKNAKFSSEKQRNGQVFISGEGVLNNINMWTIIWSWT